MIEYRIKDPEFFIRAMKSIATIVDETGFQFCSGIRTYGLDSSHITLYELVIGKSQLDIINDGKINLVISMVDLSKIINRLKGAKDIVIKIENGTEFIIIAKLSDKKKTFKLRALDSQMPEDHMDVLKNMPLDSVFEMNLSDLIDMMEDSEIYSESFNLITRNKKVIVNTSAINGEMESEYDLDDEVITQSCTYSLAFAKDILKALGSTDVVVSFSSGMPIMFFNKLSVDSFVRWYLAPRVEQEDF